MTISEMLVRNARMYPEDIALVELKPSKGIRKEITWGDFDKRVNRLARVLIDKGVKKGDKVINLMMNSINWLEAYFGITRTGAWVVPLNFRFLADDILYCAKVAEASAMVFGEEFIERVEKIKDDLITIKDFIFVGPKEMKPDYAEAYESFLSSGSATAPDVPIDLMDEAALYFTSGTTGKPKPILISHRNLEYACYAENRHHNQTHDDNFLCIPPFS